MSGAAVITGERELSLKFDTFPSRARQALEARITALTDALQARIEATAPVKTGKLRSEIADRVYADNPNRIAGRVSVYAPGAAGEYAKAATLEYGSNKPRRIFKRGGGIAARVARGNRRIVERMSKPARIQAFRYLRNPLEEMRPEIEAELLQALSEVVDEENA